VFEADAAAAVDLGSNSFHMIIGRLEGGSLKIIDKMRERVRLGAGLDDQKNLKPEASSRALDCLRRMGERVRAMPAGRVRAVGTNTLRQAKNGEEFLEKAREALGHPIEVIAGHEEARLIYLGAAKMMPDEGRRLVVDIGGGSTECIIGERLNMTVADSLFMGCVSFSLRFFPDDKVSEKKYEKAQVSAELELETIAKQYRSIGWRTAIGCSGTIHAIHNIIKANGWSEEGITAKGIKKLKKELIDAGSVDKLALAGLEADRKPVIAGGTAILDAVFNVLGIEKMRPSPGALREGALFDLFGRIAHEDVRDVTIRSFVERYRADVQQAEQVAKTAESLLEQVDEAWDLDFERSKQLLTWAAHLYEIGVTVSHTGYQKHGAYLVENSDMAGFSRLEQSTLAVLVGGHRRKLKPDLFAHIPKAEQGEVKRLLALFRLAARLNRSRSLERPEIFLTASGDNLTMLVPRSWLDRHPLTREDLMSQADRLRDIGMRFDMQEMAR
jgi:exopolyphosphatase / guanosine-5'-triphosphate,3'-diphosphate pyrophosphatase